MGIDLRKLQWYRFRIVISLDHRQFCVTYYQWPSPAKDNNGSIDPYTLSMSCFGKCTRPIFIGRFPINLSIRVLA